MLIPFKLQPIYRDYVWGGKRLRPNAEITAEAWIVSAEDLVLDGPYSGKTLANVAELEGEAFLGTQVTRQTGNRFPLLIKLLDCSKWLSLQVHPNDEQAQSLEGAGHFGKTEAWYVIDADEGAQLISGFRAGVTRKQIDAYVGKKDLLDLVERRNVHTGDVLFIAPGTIHALGAGLFIYEVQQNSDITYRVYDWDRPLTAGRKLHIEESKQVLNPGAKGNILTNDQNPHSNLKKTLVTCDFFTLDLISLCSGSVQIDLKGKSFSALTALQDTITVRGSGWSFDLHAYETLILPASSGDYCVESLCDVAALLSHCAKTKTA
ncbi:MAG: type I phosphomannose isomerase catalytic subunit [Anaerolineaceae bacterium]